MNATLGNNSTQSLISSAHVFSEVIMRGLGGNMHHCWGRHTSAFVSKVELESEPPKLPPSLVNFWVSWVHWAHLAVLKKVHPPIPFSPPPTPPYPHTVRSTLPKVTDPWQLAEDSPPWVSQLSHAGNESLSQQFEFSPSFVFLYDFVLFLHLFLKLLRPALVSLQPSGASFP